MDEVNKELWILRDVLTVEQEHLALRLNGYSQAEAVQLLGDLQGYVWNLLDLTMPEIELDIPQNWDVG